jgi:hypothetical protein
MSGDKNQLRPEDLIRPINAAYGNFDREIELLPDTSASLQDAEKHLRELQDLRIKYLGKKSELATQKKLIGSIDPTRRGEAGSNIQKFEQTITKLPAPNAIASTSRFPGDGCDRDISTQ